MREILFRGKCINTGKWVHGCLVNNMFTYSEHSEFKKGEKVFEIITGDYESDNWEEAIQEETNLVRVIIESVGQFTGLTDKNGTKIFEGDIILYQDAKGEVYYCNDTCMFMAKFKTTHSAWSFDSMDDEIEVIGNIYNNPELLK